MSVVESFRKLPTPMIILHIFSKVVIGFGLGMVFAGNLNFSGWWIVCLGVILSIPPIMKILNK